MSDQPIDKIRKSGGVMNLPGDIGEAAGMCEINGSLHAIGNNAIYQVLVSGDFPHAALRNISVLSRCRRSATNFAKILEFSESARKCGKLSPSAPAVTNSDGGTPGRMVRSQGPNAFQTRLGYVAARYCIRPCAMRPAWTNT